MTAPAEPRLIQTRKIVEPGTAQWFNSKHEEVGNQFKDMVQTVIELGEALLAKKTELGHGKWGEWTKANLSFDASQATRYINVAKKKEQILNSAQDFSSLRQLTAAISEAKSTTPKKVYIYTYKMRDVDSLEELAKDMGMETDALKHVLDAAISDKVNELRGKNDKS